MPMFPSIPKRGTNRKQAIEPAYSQNCSIKYCTYSNKIQMNYSVRYGTKDGNLLVVRAGNVKHYTTDIDCIESN